jgi:hypothetical protein
MKRISHISLFAILVSTVALAAPPFPVPTLSEVMHGSLTNKARIRWSKVVDGNRVLVTVSGGVAERLNPNMSPEPGRLPYNLDKNRDLEQKVRASRLSGQSKIASSLFTDRTLEILAEGPKDWVVVGRWSLPLKTWRKKYTALTDLLEPMFDVQAEVFQNMKSPEQ